MPKRGKELAGESPRLPFPQPVGEDSIKEAVRCAVKRAIHNSKKSVDEIAEEMSWRLDLVISRHTLYDFTADSHAHRMPFEFSAALIKATGDYSLLKVLCEALGLPTPEPGHEHLVGFARARIEAELAGQKAEGYKARILRGRK